MKIVMTGGHHSSALPVIEEINTNHKDIKIIWFGHRHSLKGNKSDTLEYIQINSLGIPFYDLKAGKFYKTYDPIRLAKIPFGFFQALLLLNKVKPDIILSFGGYLAVPTVLAGWVLGIPSITHEQTVVVGWANKLISKFAKKVLVSWEESKKYFNDKKVIYVGLPLRKEIFKALSNSFIIDNDLPTVYITAGKTGSHKINSVIREVLPDILDITNVIHQCGDHTDYNDFDTLKMIYENIASTAKGKYYPRKFVLNDEIGEAFEKADIVVARSGAHTVKELYSLEKPCLLIPIPWVSHNEQYKNAELLVDLGIGEIINESELTPEEFITRINKMLNNIHRYRSKNKIEKYKTEYTPEKLIIKEIQSCLKQKI